MPSKVVTSRSSRRAWIGAIAVGLCVAAVILWIDHRPILIRLKDPATIDPSDGLDVVMNPFRDRGPEEAGNAFLTQLRAGPCERVLGFLSAERRIDLCARERFYRILSWQLRDRTDKRGSVKLFYGVCRLPLPLLPTNVWLTVVRTQAGWRVSDFECWY